MLEIIGTFMPLIVTTVIIGSIVVAVVKVKRKVKNMSRAVFGTEDLLEGLQQTQEEINNTPKSVSSIDRLVLPSIKEDFPDMEIEELKAKNIDKVYAVMASIDSGKLGEFGEDTNIKSQLESMAKDLDNRNGKLSDVRIHRQGITNYTKTEQNASISFQVAFEYTLTTDGQQRKHQKKLETQWVYLLDASSFNENHIFKTNCPNCGGAITNLGDKKCAYCGCDVIVDYTKTWYFNSVKFV